MSDLPQYTRRLSDKILMAVNQACEQRAVEVAGLLIQALERAASVYREHHGRSVKRRRQGEPRRCALALAGLTKVVIAVSFRLAGRCLLCSRN